MDFIKKYWWVLLIVAVLIIAAALYFKNPKNKIDFSFMSDEDLSGLLPSIQGRYSNASPTEKGIGIYLDVPLTTLVKNKSGKPVTLNNIAGSLSYEGESILQTKAGSDALKEVRVAGKTAQPVTDKFQVLINGKTIKYIKEYLLGKKPKLNYDLTAMILGNVYSFKDATVLNESAGENTNGRG